MPKIVFPTKDVTEIIILQFDFSSYLLAGDVIASAVVTCTVYSGVDSNPQAVTAGFFPQIRSNNIVENGVQEGVAGVIYTISCVVTCTNQNQHTLTGFFAVTPICI
jgi:hypothetical protein